MHPLAQARKASHDGSDTTSTTIMEIDFKKPGPGILKSTKRSIKRRTQSLSQESDHTVVEPLLQKEKDESINKCAKSIFTKSFTKTEDKQDCLNENDAKRNVDNVKTNGACYEKKKPLNVIEKSNSIVKSDYMITFTEPSTKYNNINNSNFADDMRNSNYIKENNSISHIGSSVNTILHKHDDKSKTMPKSDLIITDFSQLSSAANKHFNNDPSPLIFTTAKIHTDRNHVQSYQVNAVPITSATEKLPLDKPHINKTVVTQSSHTDNKSTSSFTSVNDESTNKPKSIVENTKDKTQTSQLGSFKGENCVKSLPMIIGIKEESNKSSSALNANIKPIISSIHTSIPTSCNKTDSKEVTPIADNMKLPNIGQSDKVTKLINRNPPTSDASSGVYNYSENRDKTTSKTSADDKTKKVKEEIITRISIEINPKLEQTCVSNSKNVQSIETCNVTESTRPSSSSQYKNDTEYHGSGKELNEETKGVTSTSEHKAEISIPLKQTNVISEKNKSDPSPMSATSMIINLKGKASTDQITKENKTSKTKTPIFDIHNSINSKDIKRIDKLQHPKQTDKLESTESNNAEKIKNSVIKISSEQNSDTTRNQGSGSSKDTGQSKLIDEKFKKPLCTSSAKDVHCTQTQISVDPLTPSTKEKTKSLQTNPTIKIAKKPELNSIKNLANKTSKSNEPLINKSKEAKSIGSKIVTDKGAMVKTESGEPSILPKKSGTDRITGATSKQVAEVQEHEKSKAKNYTDKGNSTNGNTSTRSILEKSATPNSTQVPIDTNKQKKV